MHNIFKRNGITLVELMLALLITTVVIGAVYGAFRAGLSTWKKTDSKTTVYQNVRVTLDQMSREIRSIFVNPDNPAIKFVGRHEKLNFVCAMPPGLVEGMNKYDLHSVTYFIADSRWEKGKALWKYDEVKPIPVSLFSLNLTNEENLESEIIKNSEELLPMINEVRFRYYNGDSWQDEWGNEEVPTAGVAGMPPGGMNILPKSIEITIVIQYDEKGEYKETFSTTEDVMLN